MSNRKQLILAVFASLVCFIVCFHAWKSCSHKQAKPDIEIALDSSEFYHKKKIKLEAEGRLYEDREKYHQQNYKRLKDSMDHANHSQWLQFKRDSNRAVIYDSIEARALRDGFGR